jgi:hypothetical protein
MVAVNVGDEDDVGLTVWLERLPIPYRVHQDGHAGVLDHEGGVLDGSNPGLLASVAGYGKHEQGYGHGSSSHGCPFTGSADTRTSYHSAA